MIVTKASPAIKHIYMFHQLNYTGMGFKIAVSFWAVKAPICSFPNISLRLQ